MENFDELIFDDDEFLDEEFTTIQEPEEQPAQQETQDDLTSEVLRLKGISDPDKIKFEDENGAIVERSWDTLSREEQLNILTNNESEEDNQLTDDEIELLNSIRLSGLSVGDYINSLQPEPVKPNYKIDELSDDDLYVLDILEKVGGDNITDEELTEALQAAKVNEKLFQKTVEGLRNQYTQLERDKEMKEANARAEQQRAAYNNFASSIMNEIRGLNSFAGQDLELSNEDVEELSTFMLDIDNNGMSAFGRAMQDPALFTRAAFWLLNEDKIIEELSKQMQETYTRGYDNAKKDMQNKSKLVINRTTKQNDNFNNFVDDDDWY